MTYAVELIQHAAKHGNAFAASLLAQYNELGGLTRRQVEAVQAGFRGVPPYPGQLPAQVPAAAAPVPMPQPQAAQPVAPRFAPLLAAFGAALGKGVQRPRLRLAGYVFQHNGKPETEASVHVYNGGAYLGSFNRYTLNARGLPQHVQQELEGMAADPHKAAVQHGKLTGSCAVCSRKLTDPVSVANGIGPVCAGRMGWSA